MNAATSRGLIAFAAAPVAAASVVASALGLSAVAHAASVIPGVNTHTSGMVLSKEYMAQQKQEQGTAAKPIELQMQQEDAEPDSPAKQERSALMGNIRAEEVKGVALNTVESLENDQTIEPKANVSAPKTMVHGKLGLMHRGWSQMGG